MIAERGITDSGDSRMLATFNEFLGQLRAEGSFDEYARQTLIDVTNAGLMPLLTRTANRRQRRRKKRSR